MPNFAYHAWMRRDDQLAAVTYCPSTVTVEMSGNPITKVIPVQVEDTIDMALTFEAKLDFEETGSKWVTIDTADLQNPVIHGDDHAYLATGAVHDGAIYGNDGKYYIDWNYWAVVTNLYMIEPEYGYDITPGGIVGYQNMPTDMSTMPAMTITGTDAEGNEATAIAGDMPIYMDVSEQLIMWDVAASEDIAEISGWNLSDEFESTPGGLAYLGLTKQVDDDGVECDAWSYAVLTNTGKLYTVNIIAYLTGGEIDYSAYISELGQIDLEFDYPEQMNMMYVDREGYQGLLIAYSDSPAALYYADLNTFASGKIGSIPGTNILGSMYFADELAVTAPASVANCGEKLELNAKVGPDRSYVVPAKLTNDRLTFADGSLASVAAEAQVSESENVIRVDLTETANTVSGLFTVTYDPAVLTYTGSTSALLTAEKVENGTITLAYANGRELAADSALASLTFTANAAYYDTEIVIETLQRGAADVTGETSTVSVSKKAEVIAYGWSGYTNWRLTADGTLTFIPTEQTENGQTNLKNYWKVNGVLTLPWSAYAEMITSVVVEDGIHDIGQMAFYELPNLKRVTLGADIVEIRNYAFKNCTSLTDINLENVDFIREGAFYGCSSLETVNLMDGVVIEDWAFSKTPNAFLNP